MPRVADGAGPGAAATPAAIEVPGTVLESLPNALYRVQLETEARPQVVAHVSGAAALRRILPGEGVVVELLAYDSGRGRIVRRRF
jgi:translation initiation factor IF-1